jgi:uncharacterized membrane protein
MTTHAKSRALPARRLIAGGALVAVGVIGAVTVARSAAVGGLTDARGRKPVRRSITIGRPRDEVYAAWRDLDGLPRFMRHLEEVRSEPGTNRSHWRATGPFGATVEWDAEITEDIPGRRIAWRAVDGSPITHEGSVTFEDAPGGRGTQVTVDFRYAPPAGLVGVAAAKVAGEEPEQQVAGDLRRFKQLLEIGEVTAAVPAPDQDLVTA